MSDLIERQAVLEKMKQLRQEDIEDYGVEIPECFDAERAITAIAELPSVSTEKTGHWIEEDMFDGDVAYRCSECNELFWLESGTPKDNEYNFCPKCGAKLGVKE